MVAVSLKKAWVAFIIVGRELLVLGLRAAVSASDGTVVAPSIWGKLKANVQFVAIIIAIWQPALSVGNWTIAQVALGVAAVVTIASGAEYLARFGGVLVRRDE